MLWLSSLVSYHGPTHFALWTFAIIFVLGWAFQLSGHLIEGNMPAFISGPSLALIAPLFLTAELCFKLGRMQQLREDIHIPPGD